MVGEAVIFAKSYIFIHVPKTGGQSITAALGANLKGGSGGYAKHAPLRDIKCGSRFVFGFVRNPWDRMVSLYRFHCQKHPTQSDRRTYDREETISMGFKAWLMTDHFYMLQDKCRDMPPMQRRPQLWWLEGSDFIGRFENIENDFNRAVVLAGATDTLSLGHINATTGGDWRDGYDAESRAFVAKHFAPDIERFNYKCE